VEAVADAAAARGEYPEAASVLREFVGHVPRHLAGLLRLVEVSVDGGLEPLIREGQVLLAEAYLADGRADEARVVAEDLVSLRADPAHVSLLRRSLLMLGVQDPDAVIRARLGIASRQAEPSSKAEAAAAEAKAHAAAAEIDLTAVLADLERHASTMPPVVERPQHEDSLDEVFAALRAQAGTDEDDAGAHIEEAKRSLEQGRPEEAARLLLKATQSVHHRFTAASLLAQVQRDQGDLPAAVEWYERAVEAPPPTPEDARALLYELGDLLDMLGENARALAVFMELHADRPAYRDVAARVERLSRGGEGG
jgi:tetratricopeptide (TPR) repeat protein